MQLELAFRQVLAQALGGVVRGAVPVHGGSIHQAYRVHVGVRSYFVKTSERVPQQMFEREAQGLELLRATGLVRVPVVMSFSDDGPFPYLATEWIDTRPTSEVSAGRLGEALAAMHLLAAPRWGLDVDNYIGTLPQSNHEEETWAQFYAERRLRVMARFGRRSQRLPGDVCDAVDRLADELPGWLPEPEDGPSLLHGDLWGGNWLTTTGDEPVVIDPAVYYGAREVELAFTEMFGGFGPSFMSAYQRTYPLPEHYEELRSLYQLYPVLVHANLFGGSYVAEARAITQRYLGR